jgi:hypothetical protein
VNGCGWPDLPGFGLKFAAGPACREIGGGLPNEGQQQQEGAAWQEGIKDKKDDAKKFFPLVGSWIAGLRPGDLMRLLRELIAVTSTFQMYFQGLGPKPLFLIRRWIYGTSELLPICRLTDCGTTTTRQIALPGGKNQFSEVGTHSSTKIRTLQVVAWNVNL